MVSIVSKQFSETLLTNIIKVDEPNQLVLVDCALQDALNDHLLKSHDLLFEAIDQNIKHYFTIPNIKLIQFQRRRALSFSIPKNIVRLQRREYYRVATPIANPILCELPILKDGIETIISLPLLNISCGGLSLIDDKQKLGTEIERTYKDCRIVFDSNIEFTVTLRVKGIHEQQLMNKKVIYRIRCQFVDLSQATLNVIQRLIIKLEQMQNKRLKRE